MATASHQAPNVSRGHRSYRGVLIKIYPYFTWECMCTDHKSRSIRSQTENDRYAPWHFHLTKEKPCVEHKAMICMYLLQRAWIKRRSMRHFISKGELFISHRCEDMKAHTGDLYSGHHQAVIWIKKFDQTILSVSFWLTKLSSPSGNGLQFYIFDKLLQRRKKWLVHPR